MYKTTRTGERRRVNGHASFLCIMNHNRAWLGMLLIMVLYAGVFCGCGKKSDAVYIAAEESSDAGTEAVSDDSEATVSESNTAQADEAVRSDGSNTNGDDDASSNLADSTGTAGSSDSDSEDGLLYVYVCGAVESPGLYALKDGSRIYDAITAAGGLAADACPDYWNQAAYVSDGQMIDVPTQTEVDEGLVSQSAGNGATGLNSDSGTSGSTGDLGSGSGSTGSSSGPDSGSSDMDGTASSGKVNINTATQEELMTLSGIGEARASAIINYREENGSFSSIEDIKNVSGIGDALYEKICDEIVVD